jgi:serine/threonine protein kinase
VIFKQIVRLVSYCHQIGIYFGDFRLQKLVYINRKNNQIRVLNLRNIYVAPLINDDLIQKPSSKCCPAYIAPEMMRFDQPYSAKFADIWSLGILLFVLLTGRFPFYASKPSQLARMIRTGHWSFKPSEKLSRSARLLVYGLIRQNPMERPSSKEILTCDWFQSQFCEPASGTCSALPRPHVTVQIVVPSNGRLNEFNPRIPQQLLAILMQPSSERTSIYLSRSSLRASMESFANALNRSMTAGVEASVQTVPERTQMTPNGYERDSLNISVIRVPSAARNANSS